MTLLAALVLAQGPTPLADLAFDHGDGHIWLKGSLNAKAAGIVLDTGAVAGLDLTKRLVQRGSLDVLGIVAKSPVYASTVGLGGKVYRVDLAHSRVFVRANGR